MNLIPKESGQSTSTAGLEGTAKKHGFGLIVSRKKGSPDWASTRGRIKLEGLIPVTSPCRYSDGKERGKLPSVSKMKGAFKLMAASKR